MPREATLEVGLIIEHSAPPLNPPRLRDLLRYAAHVEGREGEVGVWICSDHDMADLHQRYMNIPGPTDVLSFNGDEPYLGDIAVSYDTASVQARDAGHSVQREIAYLTLHGLLHLFGYDDLAPSERERMFKRQDEIIGGFEMEDGDDWG